MKVRSGLIIGQIAAEVLPTSTPQLTSEEEDSTKFTEEVRTWIRDSSSPDEHIDGNGA